MLTFSTKVVFYTGNYLLLVNIIKFNKKNYYKVALNTYLVIFKNSVKNR